MIPNYKHYSTLIVLTIFILTGYYFNTIPKIFFLFVFVVFYILSIRWSILKERCPQCQQGSMTEYTPKELNNDSLIAVDIIGAVSGLNISGGYFQKKIFRCHKCNFEIAEESLDKSKYGCLSTGAGMGCLGYFWFLVLLLLISDS